MKILQVLTNPQNKLLPYLQGLLMIYAVVLTFPALAVIPFGSALDLSWKIGLYKGNIQGLIHGKDILFTYGPLGYLIWPMYIDRSLWLNSVIYNLLQYILTLFCFSLFTRKTKANLLNTALFVFVYIGVFTFPVPEHLVPLQLPVSVFILSYLYVFGGRRILFLAFLAFLYVIMPFISFSSAAMVFIIGLAFWILLLLNGRYKEAFLFLGFGSAFLVLISLVLFGTLQAFFVYLYGCLQIAGGYGTAMAVDGPASELLCVVLAWIFYIGLMVYNSIRKRRRELFFLILGFGLLFVSYKQGFVRHDSHVFQFYAMWTLVLALFYLECFTGTKIVKYVVLTATLALFFQYSVKLDFPVKHYIGEYVPSKAIGLRHGFNLLRGVETDKFEQIFRNVLSEHYNLRPETVELLSGHTFDVFPWDIAMAELYGFKWNPRPVFQSYQAYTSYLDLLNAGHFSPDDTPEYIIYSVKSIDRKYPVFYEPATFRRLLMIYEPCSKDGEFIILRKKAVDECDEEVFISRTTAKFSEAIILPKVEDALLFAKIRIEYNLLGHLSNFFYKPPKVYIGFAHGPEIISVRRFVFTNAENGVFVSQYINNNDDLWELCEGNITYDLNNIAVLTENPAFFEKEIKVEFFKVVNGGKQD